MLKTVLVIVSLMSGSMYVMAHEDHSLPQGALTANHGGVVKPGKEINLEYVVTGSEVKIFPATHEGKDLNSAAVSLTATTKLPKGKAEAAKIDFKDGSFILKADFKSAYRVEIIVTATVEGKKDIFKFQIEK